MIVEDYDIECERIAATLSAIYSRELHMFLVIDSLIKQKKNLFFILLTHKVRRTLFAKKLFRDFELDALTLAYLIGGTKQAKTFDMDRVWITRSKINPITAEIITRDGSLSAKLQISVNPQIGEKVLRRLRVDGNELIKGMVLQNVNCPSDLLTGEEQKDGACKILGDLMKHV